MLLSTTKNDSHTLIVAARALSLRVFIYDISISSITASFSELLLGRIIDVFAANTQNQFAVAVLSTRHLSVYHAASDHLTPVYTICHADVSMCDNTITLSARVLSAHHCFIITDTKYFFVDDENTLQYANVKLDNGKSFHPVSRDTCEVKSVYSLDDQLIVVILKCMS